MANNLVLSCICVTRAAAGIGTSLTREAAGAVLAIRVM